MRVLALLALAACTADTGSLLDESSGDADTGSIDAEAGTMAADCGPTFNIDFPCDETFRCVNQGQYVERRTVWCQELVPAGCPCSGGTCMELTEIHTCPSPTICNIDTNPFRDDETCVDPPAPDAGISD